MQETSNQRESPIISVDLNFDHLNLSRRGGHGVLSFLLVITEASLRVPRFLREPAIRNIDDI